MEFTIRRDEADHTLARVLREHLGLTWNAARALCTRGKVFVGDARELDPAARLPAGAAIAVRERQPAPLSPRQAQAAAALVYEDSQLVVIDKPAGISSVPYERSETGTAMDLIRDAWRVQRRRATEVPLHVVHRIDKETSGLLLFAKTRTAERELQALLRAHAIARRYLCVAHGRVTDRRIESSLVSDRGDGLRGSARAGREHQGKRAVTHVRAVEFLPRATVCEVELETGKTHQIRIHLSEAGHPLVGERVYIRDYLRRHGEPLPSRRLLLHALTLGFSHPTTGEQLTLSRPPPPDFETEVARLRAAAPPGG